MRATLKLIVSLMVLQGIGQPAGSQAPGRRVFSSDTMNVDFPAISPDGRWLVLHHRIDNQTTRLMIRELPNGELRELYGPKGDHSHPRFTANGDRLFFVSSLPQRGPADDQRYLVAATFDTRTGTLTSEPRQITLDGVRSNVRTMPVLSPDGQWIAYVECCSTSALKVVPSVGGNSRMIADHGAALRAAPGWLGWTGDSRFVTYEIPNPDGGATRFRVNRDGGAATTVARFERSTGIPSPDGRYFAIVAGGVRNTLRLFAADGSLITSVPAAGFAQPSLSFSADGKYLVGASSNTSAAIKLAQVAGGPIRQIGRGDSYEWVAGWNESGSEVHLTAVENDREVAVVAGLDGVVKNRIPIPEGSTLIGVRGGTVVFRERIPGRVANHRLVAIRIADGSRKDLGPTIIPQVCCEPVGAGGMYYGIVGDEIYAREVRGNRLQIRAVRLDGSSRLIASLPRSLLGKTGFAIFQNRVVYMEPVRDSLRLQLVVGVGRPPRTIATFPAATPYSEYAWSHDGRKLSLFTSGRPWGITVFSFDAAGAPEGAPKQLVIPFEYSYETFWLPDNSGLTMIAQPTGSAVTEVALVKLNDPEHPILLTKDDPVSKWGHALSPDGKYVAYPSERMRGSSIYLIEVAALLKNGDR